MAVTQRDPDETGENDGTEEKEGSTLVAPMEIDFASLKAVNDDVIGWIYVEALDGTRRMINRAYVVVVAIDHDGKAKEIPGLIVETESERAEWEGGERRYQLRKKRRQEGY